MPRSAPLILTDAERNALELAKRTTARHSHYWHRIQIVLALDRAATGLDVARRLRFDHSKVYQVRKQFVNGGRTPAALHARRVGRPVGRMLEVLPLLRAIRRDAGREMFGQEYRDALAERHGIDLELSSVARYLKLGKIPTRGQRRG